MDLPKHRLKSLKRLFPVVLSMLFTLALIISSCNQEKVAKSGYSASFEKVVKHVDTLFGTNRVKQGLHVLDSAYAQISHPTPDDIFRRFSYHFSYEHNTLGNNKTAILYADSMMSAVKADQTSPNHFANFAEAEFCMGDAYFSLGKYNEAYTHFLSGYQVGKDHLNSTSLQWYTYRMGMITYKIGSFKLAANYFERSYSYHHKEPTEFVEYYAMQELLDNIGLSFKHEGLPDSAIFYFDKDLQFIQKYGPRYADRPKMNEIAAGVVYGNKAEVLTARKQYEQAAQMLRKSIAINLQKDYDNNDALLAEVKLGQIYFDNHQDAELLQLLQQMKPQIDSVKNEDAMADWNRLMSGYEFRRGNLKDAYGYLHTYNKLKDSTNKKLSLLRESDVNRLIDTYEHEQQIDEITANNRFKRIYLLAALIVSILSLLVIWLVVRNWRRSKKDIVRVNQLNRQINEQNVTLNKAFEELQVSSNEKDRILHSVAHDLRNPLGGISSLADLILEEVTEDELREQIGLIKETSVNALDLINEILEVTNITPARTNLEPVDMNALVANCVSLLRFKATEKNQELNLLLPEQKVMLRTNREKIWRVISNLIINAIKFSPDGAPVTVALTAADDHIQISVEDNGVGVPEKYRDQIFNMFTSARRPGTAGEKSFGLGLSICKQIIEQFHGKIWFESRQQGGTIFYISLPVSSK